MAGLRELSALATSVHEPSAVKASELAAHPVDKPRQGYAKRRRLQQFRAPCADSLESLHLTWEEFQAKAAEWQKGMAERESAVTVREVACCSVEARLAQRSAQLEEWEGRLRAKAGQLEAAQAALQEQQERFGRLAFSSPKEETDSDAEAADSPPNSMQPGAGGGFWAPHHHHGTSRQFGQQPGDWRLQPQFRGFWADGTQFGSMSPVHLGAPTPAAAGGKPSQQLPFEPLNSGDAQGKARAGVRQVSGTPTPANSYDSQSHGSADTAAAGHAVHSRPAAAPSPGPAADYHVVAHEDTPPLFKSAPVAMETEPPQQASAVVVMPSKLGMKLAKMEAQGGAAAGPWGRPQPQQQPQAQHLEPHEQPRTPPRHASLLSTAEQRLGSLAEAAEVLEGGRRSFQQGVDGAEGDRSAEAAVAGPFMKALDYKSCDHILCLTKDMARELFPPAPHSSAGGPSQATVELEDDSGRMWQMTYRCVPHRYSYELRAGWKAFAHFWNVGVGDTVALWQAPAPRSTLRISIRAHSPYAPCPAAATRHGASQSPAA